MNYRIATRRKPVVIDLNNDEEDTGDEEDTMDVDDESSQRRKRHRQPPSSDSSSESEKNANCDSNDDEPCNENNDPDLTNLNSVSLKKKIRSEVKLFRFLFLCIYYILSFICIQRPQWRNHQDEDAATQQEVDPTDHVADPHNDSDMGADIPNTGHHEAATTASEFDGALDAPGDEDEVTEDIGGVDDKSDDEASGEHQKISKKVRNEHCSSHASS